MLTTIFRFLLNQL